MYCKSCGADEPEIKINDKAYCSNCGLSLEPETAQEKPAEEMKSEETTELKKAFSELENSLTNNETNSYRSKDIGVVKRSESSNTENPVETESSLDLENIKEANTQKIKRPIQEDIEKDLNLTSESTELDENTLSPDVSKIKETDEPQEKEEVETSLMTEEEARVGEKDKKDLEEAIKKVDELGVASKLVDILEENSKSEERVEKIKRNKDIADSFDRLIDILNQPIEKKKPEKKEGEEPFHKSHSKPEEKLPIDKNEIEKSLDSLNETKELTQGQEFLEIEQPKETKKGADIEKIINEEIGWEMEESKGNWPIFENIEKSKKSAQKTSTKEVELSPKEKKAIEKEIHALGDKKGHVDHWPEEDVVNFTPKEEGHKHHGILSDFMKNIIEEKRHHKTDSKKKKKRGKEKKTALIAIIVATALSFAALGAYFVLKDKQIPSKKTTANQVEVKFVENDISYIPPGFEQDGLSEKNKIIYKYLPDENQKIIFTEKVVKGDFNIEKNVQEKAQSYKKIQESSKILYILNDKDIMWLENGTLMILENKSNTSLEEIKKMVFSVSAIISEE